MSSLVGRDGGPVRILSIDGGGIRGVVPAVILAEIERRTGRRIAEMFDLVAGTSTGGIIALMLARPGRDGHLCSAADVVSFYEDHGPEIFACSLWHSLTSVRGLAEEKYQADGLERLLRERLGEVRLSEATVDLLITAYDIERQQPFFFKSRSARTNPRRDYLMRDVARATSAAPSYFEPARICNMPATETCALIDGGVFASNPAMCALAEARAIYPASAEVLLVSVGTGEAARTIRYREARRWGGLRWARPMIRLTVDSGGEVVDYQLEQLLGPVDGQRRYFRLQQRVAERSAGPDDVSPEHIRTLRALGEAMARRQEVDSICQALALLPLPQCDVAASASASG